MHRKKLGITQKFCWRLERKPLLGPLQPSGRSIRCNHHFPMGHFSDFIRALSRILHPHNLQLVNRMLDSAWGHLLQIPIRWM